MTRRLMVFLIVAACGASARPAAPQFVAVNAPGELVDVEATLVTGLVNVVEFRADWCGACEVVEANLRRAVTGDARIVVRTVDIGDGESVVAAAYGVRSLPHAIIVDRKGEIRHRLLGDDALRAGELALAVAAEP
jgi:hypothetical protein